jgi:hypothetical protein
LPRVDGWDPFPNQTQPPSIHRWIYRGRININHCEFLYQLRNQIMSFRRINFFKGLFMAAEDWKAEQKYHIEKRRLHTRSFFTPGIVSREDDEFDESSKASVTPAGRIVIQPGYALDGHGRDLYLDKPEELDPPQGASEKDFFIFIAYNEEKIERRDNHLNPELKDHAFTLERPDVGWDDKQPDNVEKLELGRVRWQPGKIIRTIDTTHVRRAAPRHTASMAEQIMSGDITITPKTTDAENENRNQIDTRDLETGPSGNVYLANVYPTEPMDDGTSVRWRIESSTDKERVVRYSLFLEGINIRHPVKVHVEVYRLKLGA